MRREDVETLTRVGPGTPMGELMRCYWIPCALSSALEAGGAIHRLTLLGERFVILRAPDGRVSVVQAACPHRGASLHLARNEAAGLRCVYHGWQFDAAGRCVDMPNEPEDLRFCDKVRARALTVQERGGVVWVHFGDGATPLPELEWNTRDGAWLGTTRRDCNWAQALEGDLDSSHIGLLHGRFDDPSGPTTPGAAMPGPWGETMRLLRGLGPPRIDVVDTDYGALYSARRAEPDGREYHRVHPFLFPFHTMLGGGLGGEVAFSGKAWVPIDDTHTLVLEWQYRPDRPWSADERRAIEASRYPFAPGEAPGPETDYGRDRALEARQFFGVISNPQQDRAVEESMGVIAERAHEHLGPADQMIIQVRRRLLAAARALRDHGTRPPGADAPSLYRVRPVGTRLPAGADWLIATAAAREAWR